MDEERIEEWRMAFSPNVTTNIAEINAVKREVDQLCDLAIRGLRTMPRPIEEAPKDGTELVLYFSTKEKCFASWKDDGWWQTMDGEEVFGPSHFFVASALEE